MCFRKQPHTRLCLVVDYRAESHVVPVAMIKRRLLLCREFIACYLWRANWWCCCSAESTDSNGGSILASAVAAHEAKEATETPAEEANEPVKKGEQQSCLLCCVVAESCVSIPTAWWYGRDDGRSGATSKRTSHWSAQHQQRSARYASFTFCCCCSICLVVAHSHISAKT